MQKRVWPKNTICRSLPSPRHSQGQLLGQCADMSVGPPGTAWPTFPQEAAQLLEFSAVQRHGGTPPCTP